MQAVRPDKILCLGEGGGSRSALISLCEDRNWDLSFGPAAVPSSLEGVSVILLAPRDVEARTEALLARLRAEAPSIPCLLLPDAPPSSEQRSGLFRSGAFDILVVPMDRDEASAKIGTALQLKRAADQEREERLTEVFEVIPQGVWRANRDGSTDYFSERFYRTVGYRPEDFLGWAWVNYIHPDDVTRVITEWERCREHQQPFAMDFRIRTQHSGYRWFRSLGNPFFESGGELVHYFGTWTDIHDQKTALAELEMKSDALENSLNAFDIVSAEGKFLYANPSYLKMWGYDRLEEIIGTSPIHHCADPEVPSLIIRTLKEQGECTIEFTGRRKDGSLFDVMMWARLAHDSEGREIYPTTSIDITERKRAERAMKAAKEEAEQANAFKSAFIANISHEIRTPLGAMLGFNELLKDPSLSPYDRTRFVEIISRNGNQLLGIIDDILDLSKIEAGQLVLETVESRPREIVSDVIKLLDLRARQKNLRLESFVDPATPEVLMSDPTRIRQVLLNLLGNALKFTSEGSVILTCQPDTGSEGRLGVAFEVSDTGIGVPNAERERIFEAFAQADPSMTRKFGGTGLGLSVSRSLAKTLGGELTLRETRGNRGSVFRFTIQDLSAVDASSRTPASAVPALPTSNDPLADLRLLVVDDSEDNRHLLHRHLTRLGAKVVTAEDGAQGSRKALEDTYDMVLMDLEMPRMDGFAALREIRRRGYMRPVLAVTAFATTEMKDQCRKAGFDDFLPKPVDFTDLIAKISRLSAQRNRLQKEF